MICVLEGPDGTGKTTLAREIEKRGFYYVHNGPPPEGADVFGYYTDQILEARKTHTVFDRLHLGELVYGTVIRKNPKLNIEQIRLLNRLLNSIGCLHIFCLTDARLMKESFEARIKREYVKSFDDIVKIDAWYRDLLTQEYVDKNFTYTVYDLRDHFDHPWYFIGPQQGTNRLMLPLNLLPLSCQKGVIGNPEGRFLIVGEQAGSVRNELKFKGPLDLPFYSYERSSHFLNECLWDAGFHEGQLQFTNALNIDGQPRDIRALFEEQPKIVIALGQVAQKQCEQQGVPHLPAEHPQYVKRFKLSKRRQYVGLLRNYRTGGK